MFRIGPSFSSLAGAEIFLEKIKILELFCEYMCYNIHVVKREDKNDQVCRIHGRNRRER